MRDRESATEVLKNRIPGYAIEKGGGEGEEEGDSSLVPPKFPPRLPSYSFYSLQPIFSKLVSFQNSSRRLFYSNLLE